MRILMPQLGETVNEGTISAWYAKVGDEIKKDDILVDVETDKVAVEIPAPESGVLSKINVDAGETVEVGTILAIIGHDNEMPEDSVDAEQISDLAEEVVEGRPVTTTENNLSRSVTSLKLSPVVRRLVAEHNVDLDKVSSSARDGRITRNDVLAFIDSASSVVSSVTGQALEETVIAFSRIRKLIADHMVRSKATSPHVLQAIEVDFSAVDSVRLSRKSHWKEQHGFSLSYLPFIAYAACRAIESHPKINSSVIDDSLHVHGAINLAIAIDLDHEGLLAPVLKDVGSLGVRELAMKINELVGKARTKGLKPTDMSGGTYTISNPGPFGTLFTAPIINQPQVAILSSDVVQKKPVVMENPSGDTIVIRPVGVLSQSFDHRAFDGAYSASFLQSLKSTIEKTDWSKAF